MNAPIAVHDLGPLQVKILKALWSLNKPCSVQEILDQFPGDRLPSYVTILTVMRRLEKRGFLTHTVDGRKFIYQATVAQSLLQLSLLADMRNRFFTTGEEFRHAVDQVLAPA